MSEAQRAVGELKKRGNPASLGAVNIRVTELEDRLDKDLGGVHAKLDDVLRLLGKPSNGPAHPAEGIFYLLEGLDKRVLPFESLRLQVKGALKLGVPMLAISGAALWFLAGDKISALFHG